jgi:hypothetical protein
MTDRVTAEELADTAPAPEDDFQGFVDRVAERVLRSLLAEQRLPPMERAETNLLHSLTRMALGIAHHHPRVAQQLYAKGLARSLANWAALIEQPDQGGNR